MITNLLSPNRVRALIERRSDRLPADLKITGDISLLIYFFLSGRGQVKAHTVDERRREWP